MPPAGPLVSVGPRRHLWQWVERHSRGLAGEFLQLAAATAALQGASFLIGLVLAGVLTPTGYGDWSLVLIVAGYASYAQLGATNGMNRDVPLVRGAGDTARAERIAAAALTGVLAATVAGIVGLLLLPRTWVSPTLPRGSLAAAGVYLAGYQLFAYVKTYFESHKRFGWSARLQGTVAPLALVGAISLGVTAGVPGAVAGMGIGYFLGSIVTWRWDGGQVRPLWDAQALRALVRVGLPIMLVGLAQALMVTIDRWVILRYLGPEAVGLYSFQARLLSFTPLFAGLVAGQTYPRAAEAYGRTGDPRSILPHLRTQAVATLVLTALSAIMLWIILPLLVPVLWPAYEPSLSLLPIMLIGMVILPQCGAFGVILNVLDRQVSYLAIQVAMIGLGLALSMWLTMSPLGLRGAALAATLTYALYLLALLILTLRVVRSLSPQAAG